MGGFRRGDHEFQQMLKAAENMNLDRAAQMVPVFLSRTEYASALLIQGIAQCKDLMDKKCQQDK